MGRFQGQMPHWLGLKSQHFHKLSGIDERITKEIYISLTKYGARIQKPASMHPMDPQSLCTLHGAGDFTVSKDSTRLSVHGQRLFMLNASLV